MSLTSKEISEDSLNNYQPNFILVGKKPSIFGDILPIYRSNQELNTTIVASWESLANLVLVSRVFLVCITSLVIEILHNLAYQSALTLSEIYEQVLVLPESFNGIRNKIQNLFETLSNSNTRDLWWIDVKLEYKSFVRKLVSVVKNFFRVISKFYLAGVVGAILFILSFTSSSSGFQTNSSSILGKVLNNYSNNAISYSYSTAPAPVSLVSLLSEQGQQEKKQLLDKIIQHQVLPDQSIDMIAEMYGLLPQTVIFNNQIKEGEALPKTLYIPWIDGYIYKADKDISVEELQRIYSIDASLIYSKNEDSLDRGRNVFPKGSFVLIPTTNFESIANANIQEIARQEQQEREARIKNSINQANGTTYSGFFTSARSQGFIWPAEGSISRCVEPNHIACDIANGSLPPIFAVQNATVHDVYRFNVVGYGNAVVLDHGNGVKTLYAHMSEIYVSKGQTVSQGQAIGRMGCTGFCTGPHVHFEVIINGVKVNPRPFLP